jgi:hypothetical protein
MEQDVALAFGGRAPHGCRQTGFGSCGGRSKRRGSSLLLHINLSAFFHIVHLTLHLCAHCLNSALRSLSLI